LSPDSLYLDVTFVTLAMLVIGGTGSLFGAVVGVATVTSIVEFLRLGDDSSGIGAQTISLPSGSQQVALAALMAIILILRPAGLTNGREIPLPKWLRSRWKVGDCGRLGVAPRPDGTAPPSAGEIELDQADGSSQR
jgi:branched-chain amino acid transport system permease protein